MESLCRRRACFFFLDSSTFTIQRFMEEKVGQLLRVMHIPSMFGPGLKRTAFASKTVLSMHAPSFKTSSPSAPTQSHSSSLSPEGRRVGCVKCDLQWHTKAGFVHGPSASRRGQPTCERGVRGRKNASKPGIPQFPGSGRQLTDMTHPHMGPSLSKIHQRAGRTSMGSLHFRRSDSCFRRLGTMLEFLFPLPPP